MCIILTCEGGVRPTNDLIETCFYNNPDGAGIMWCEDGYVQTAKGFMDVDDLCRAIDNVPLSSRLVIHMRIATSGGIDVGTCHPFPVCDNLDALHAPYVECAAAVAHNGVIQGMPTDEKRGISDTVFFVANIVDKMYAKNGRVTKGMLRKMKELAPSNRFAIMTSDGSVYRIGSGWETVTTGIQASNYTWRYGKLFYYEPEDKWYSDYLDSDYYESSAFEEAYTSIFDGYCEDCPYKATCMSYGPICDDVSARVDEYFDMLDEYAFV